MMNTLLLNNTAFGTIPAIVDPSDGTTATTPSALSALVIKNGTDTVDSVTITAVGGGRTGVYKWSYNPSGEVEGDAFSIVFTITISSVDYYHTVDLIVEAAERGTDSANTTTPPTAAAIRAEMDSNSTQLAAIVEDTGTTLPSTLSGIETKVDTVDGVVDDILVDTGTTLPASLTSVSSAITVVDGIVDDILVDTSTTLPATLSAMETKIDTVDTVVDTLTTSLTGVETKIDTIDGIVDSILVDTGTTLPASLSGLETKVDTIDSIVDDILVDTGTTLPATLTTIDTEVGQVLDRAGYTVAVLTGAISNADTSTNTFAVTIDGVTYTVTNNGIGTDGDRTAPTLAKA